MRDPGACFEGIELKFIRTSGFCHFRVVLDAFYLSFQGLQQKVLYVVSGPGLCHMAFVICCSSHMVVPCTFGSSGIVLVAFGAPSFGALRQVSLG